MTRPGYKSLLGLTTILVVIALWLALSKLSPPAPGTGSGGVESDPTSTHQSQPGQRSENAPAVTFQPASAKEARTANPPTPADDREIGVRLHEWLTSSTDTAVIAGRIAREFATVKPKDQATVARELIPLVTDDVYADRLPGIVLDPKLSPEAHRLFFRDLTLRSDEVGLPLLLEIAKLGDAHPQAAEAKIRLAIRFGGDPESSWEAWQPYVTAELAQRRALLQAGQAIR